LNVVPERHALSKRMMNCGQCGAGLPEHGANCTYCGTPVARLERGVGDPCPACFARLQPGAKYCGACGVAIAPQLVLSALASNDCPCCRAKLAECRSGDMVFAECTACAGLWIEKAVFERLVDEAKSKRGVGANFRETPRAAADAKPSSAPLYRPCPVCRDMMPRTNFGQSGIIIDWCGRHGYWFDADELSQILARAREGKLAAERARPSGLKADPAKRDRSGLLPLSGTAESAGEMILDAIIQILF
jgi:Zn-finger nucleic acid-binding protein